MASNEELFAAVQLRLKLRGEWPPPKLSASQRLQKWKDDNQIKPFELDTLLKEAREAGAELAEIARFRATPQDRQVEEILTTTNVAEPQLTEEEEQEYLAQQAKKRANWLAEKHRLDTDLEHRLLQSQRDKSRNLTLAGTLNKEQQGAALSPESHRSTTPDSPSRRKYNQWRRKTTPRTQSTSEWIEKRDTDW